MIFKTVLLGVAMLVCETYASNPYSTEKQFYPLNENSGFSNVTGEYNVSNHLNRLTLAGDGSSPFFALCPYGSNWWNLGVYGNQYNPDQQGSGNTVISIPGPPPSDGDPNAQGGVGNFDPSSASIILSSPSAYNIPATVTQTTVTTLTETAMPQNKLVAITLTLQPGAKASDIAFQRNFAPHGLSKSSGQIVFASQTAQYSIMSSSPPLPTAGNANVAASVSGPNINADAELPVATKGPQRLPNGNSYASSGLPVSSEAAWF